MTERDYNKIPYNETCPFLAKLNIKERKKLVKLSDAPNYQLRRKDGTGFGIFPDIIDDVVLATEKTLEGEFVKLFKVNFLPSLNSYALKIFTHVISILEINNNVVSLDVPKLSLVCSIDEPRKIYDGLNQLIEMDIIAKTRIKDRYYVNPSIVFRGMNRRVLFTHKEY